MNVRNNLFYKHTNACAKKYITANLHLAKGQLLHGQTIKD